MKKKIQLFTLAVASAALTFSSCKKAEDNIATSQSAATETPDISEKGTNPDEADLSTDALARHTCNAGYLYTESNATAQNEILCYKINSNGNLTLMATVASGGTGVGAGPLGLGLDGQGALALSENHNWLFAVNGGSNSVSSFKVHTDGSLTLVSTENSGGTVPVSVCIHRNILYVVNSTSSNIHGFTVDGTGTLTKIAGSTLPLSAAITDPAQIAFSPNGEYLYVTEKMTDKITSFEVDGNGLATSDIIYNSTGHTPFGFCHARDNYMVVSNANVVAPGVPVINGASCTSYGGSNPGNLNPQNGAVPNNQSASCWVATTKYGRFAFIANTGSNDLSSYYVSPWGSIYLIHGSATSTGMAPKDLTVAANNYYVYVLNTLSFTIGGFHRTFLGGLAPVSSTPNLPEFATGLVAW